MTPVRPRAGRARPMRRLLLAGGIAVIVLLAGGASGFGGVGLGIAAAAAAAFGWMLGGLQRGRGEDTGAAWSDPSGSDDDPGSDSGGDSGGDGGGT